MTREDILRQIAVLQTQLEEFDKVESRASVDAVITEAEKEKQHQEDLQRLRGLRLIDFVISKKTRKESRLCVRLWKI